jgi:hypothetical protein
MRGVPLQRKRRAPNHDQRKVRRQPRVHLTQLRQIDLHGGNCNQMHRCSARPPWVLAGTKSLAGRAPKPYRARERRMARRLTMVSPMMSKPIVPGSGACANTIFGDMEPTLSAPSGLIKEAENALPIVDPG